MGKEMNKEYIFGLSEDMLPSVEEIDLILEAIDNKSYSATKQCKLSPLIKKLHRLRTLRTDWIDGSLNPASPIEQKPGLDGQKPCGGKEGTRRLIARL